MRIRNPVLKRSIISVDRKSIVGDALMTIQSIRKEENAYPITF